MRDELWNEAKRIASDDNETMTDVVAHLLEQYVYNHLIEED